MRKYRQRALTSTVVLAITLSACGGGGSGGPNSTPTPSPTPTPTPTPSFSGQIGLRSSAPFATYSAHSAAAIGSDGSAQLPGAAAMDAPDAVEFRYLEADQSYEILLPGFERGMLEQVYRNGVVCSDGSVCNPSSTASSVTIGTSATAQDVLLTLPVPTYPDRPLGLSYTSLGWWSGKTADPNDPNVTILREGILAYGIPTAPGDVPVTGTGTYDAIVTGTTSSRDYIEGIAYLAFDFGAGSLSGYMRPSISDGWDMLPLGQYDFTQTIYSTGSESFSGKFIVPNSTADSSFDGRFTGPQAAELMARWQAPFLNPLTDAWDSMVGVWVGKRR